MGTDLPRFMESLQMASDNRHDLVGSCVGNCGKLNCPTSLVRIPSGLLVEKRQGSLSLNQKALIQ